MSARSALSAMSAINRKVLVETMRKEARAGKAAKAGKAGKAAMAAMAGKAGTVGLLLVALGVGAMCGARAAVGEEPAAGAVDRAVAFEAPAAAAAAPPAIPVEAAGATGGAGATVTSDGGGAMGATGTAVGAGASGASGATGPTDGSEARGAVGENPAIAAPLAVDVEREARAVAAGREPAVLEHSDFVQVPFGHQVPVLRCAPLRVCLIELEEGELVLNTVTGDAARWILDRAEAGPRGRTTVIVAKPTACNLTTNLVITTNRRIYQITLDARPCKSEEGENPHEPFTRLLRFYYPDELVRTWAGVEEAKRAAAAEEARAVTRLGPENGGLPGSGGPPLGALHFNYRWTRTGKYPWAPAAVFDDEVHTYIRLPGNGVGQEAPVLFLIDRHGGTALLNYAIRGQYYVTDRVFERAALVLGSGRDQQRLEITREH
jgi:P-type conjugative transfer protein TrbG